MRSFAATITAHRFGFGESSFSQLKLIAAPMKSRRRIKSKSANLSLRRKQLALEALESRQLMAGDVTAGLIHQWKFDESSGDVTADAVAGNNGSLIGWEAGENKFVKGRFGNAIDIASNNNLVQTQSTVIQQVYTFTFWIYRQGQGGLNPRLITAPASPDIIVNNEAGEGVGFYSNNDPSNVDQDPTPPAFNVWENYAVIIDTANDVNSIYKNGVLVGGANRELGQYSAPLVFGHDQNHGNNNEFWDGLMDDIRLYNRALTPTEIQTVADFGRPVVSISQGATYVENRGPIRIAPTAAVSDEDNANFAGGTMTVSIGSGATPDDELSVLSNGTGAGQISLQGTAVRYGGVQIATYTGGTSGSPLIVSFNSSATPAAAQALLRRVGFRTITDDPSTATRQILVTIDDGSSVLSRVASTSVAVTATADRPTIALGGGLTYNENQAPRILASTATLFDPDSPTFETGKLTVRVAANAAAGDRLDIQSVGSDIGQISVSGDKVSYGGVKFGNVSGGSGAQALIVTLNSDATLDAVQALVRSIRFQTLGDTPSTAVRTVNFVLTDDTAIASNLATKTINVVAVNDAPAITGQGGTLSYLTGTTALAFATANIADPDSANFAGGAIRLRFAPVSANDSLTIGGSFTETANGANFDVKLNNDVIGSRSASAGGGATALQISLNANATRAIVQQLVRSLQFSTTTTGTRQIRLLVTDGDGGQSAEVFRQVNAS